ncbi:hypothetical protein C8R41DRAFT_870837 [Lentinula lateritia]|uniref:Uncharacterized protein n=1 Tax=Lentinula lateritia TaxID=40482 RepID=A0ABQ8V1X1_9AGAR|nr:hypothetical protein C8R41DRAFT_870837 [Lentinula lateritia]
MSYIAGTVSNYTQGIDLYIGGKTSLSEGCKIEHGLAISHNRRQMADTAKQEGGCAAAYKMSEINAGAVRQFSRALIILRKKGPLQASSLKTAGCAAGRTSGSASATKRGEGSPFCFGITCFSSVADKLASFLSTIPSTSNEFGKNCELPSLIMLSSCPQIHHWNLKRLSKWQVYCKTWVEIGLRRAKSRLELEGSYENRDRGRE